MQPGTRLGPFEVIAVLGAGGMGEVYRARDTTLDRDVALKVLPASVAHTPERLARLEREARLLAALNHQHVGAIYGIQDDGSTRALVLELVEGETLADAIEGHRRRGQSMPLDEIVRVARQVASAPDAAHQKGIIHTSRGGSSSNSRVPDVAQPPGRILLEAGAAPAYRRGRPARAAHRFGGPGRRARPVAGREDGRFRRRDGRPQADLDSPARRRHAAAGDPRRHRPRRAALASRLERHRVSLAHAEDVVRTDLAASAAVFPDGRGICFTRLPEMPRGLLGDTTICRAVPEDGPAEEVARVPFARVVLAPRLHLQALLSPDGQWLAFPLADATTTNIWSVAAQGGPMRAVTDFGDRSVSIARSVSWGPDSRSLYAAVADTVTDVVSLIGLLNS